MLRARSGEGIEASVPEALAAAPEGVAVFGRDRHRLQQVVLDFV